MTVSLSDEELGLLNEVLSRRLGLVFPDYKREILASRLAPRLQELHLGTFYDYYLVLEYQPDDELDWLSRSLTNNETYFFREDYQFEPFFRSLREAPPRPHAVGPPRVLSAGCSSGEEPYSLGLFHRFRAPAQTAPGLLIDAVDIDPDRLERARRGRYSAYSLRSLGPEDVARWFRPGAAGGAGDRRNGHPPGGFNGSAPPDYELLPSYRTGVRFARVNLVDADGWAPVAPYDAVFCRNVLIYFSAEAVRRLLEQLAAWMVPGGLLFLGHSETLYGHRSPFVPERLHGCIAYRKPRP